MRVHLLTPADASLRLGVAAGTLKTWRYRGTGPAYVRVGRHVRYRSEDLAEWVRYQTVTPQTEPAGR
jgi:predicted site-specific integrase-resolvase